MSGTPAQDGVRNRLLTLMPRDDFDRLSPRMEHVDLPKGKVIVEAGTPVAHAYFFESGVGSIVAESPEGHQAEAGLFGREGFSPSFLAMGALTGPHRTMVQVAGDAWRVPADDFVAATRRSASLHNLMLRFVQTLSTQTAATSLSNAVHQIDERLARWLLMCDDRVDGGEIGLTHEFMSIMLAVRRPSVTNALHVLEGNGFIRSERGSILVRDRGGLEDFARDAYGQPEAEYRRLIGDLRPPMSKTEASTV